MPNPGGPRPATSLTLVAALAVLAVFAVPAAAQVGPAAGPQDYPAQPAPPYAQPSPAYTQAPPYAQPAPAPPYAQPAPAPSYPSPRSSFKLPPIGVRLDLLDLVLRGRLDIELEAAPLDWLSVEVVPLAVVGAQPIGHRLRFTADDKIYQGSAGIGPFAGFTAGAGFWLDGKALQGTVVRANVAVHGFEYLSRNSDGSRIDRVVDNQRRLQLLLGHHRRWGHFTLTSGFGFEYELTDTRRCFESGSNSPTSRGCQVEELYLRTTPPSISGAKSENVHWVLHPLYLVARLGIGAAF